MRLTDPAAIASAHSERGLQAYQRGQFTDAARLQQRAVRGLEQAAGPRDVRLWLPLMRLAACEQALGRLVDAGMIYQRALALLADSEGSADAETAEVYRNLAGLEHAARNWLRGEQFARHAVRLRRRACGRRDPQVALDLATLAAVLAPQGKLGEAERAGREALAILEPVLGEWHPVVATLLNNLAAVRQARGDVAGAELLFRRALAIEERELGPLHPSVARSTSNLGVLLIQSRRLREAVTLFRRAVDALARSLGPDHPDVAICSENYATALRRAGDRQAAAKALKRARAALARVDAVNPEAVAVTGTINPQYAEYRLSVRPSAIHRIGVFADEAIPAGRKVIEYTGERISRRESGRRWDPARSYLFEINERVHLDGAIGGSGAEYINHSCDPNLKTRILREHILYFSKRPIAAGEELSVDYKYDPDTDLMACACGAANCRGTMNVRVPEPTARRASCQTRSRARVD